MSFAKYASTFGLEDAVEATPETDDRSKSISQFKKDLESTYKVSFRHEPHSDNRGKPVDVFYVTGGFNAPDILKGLERNKYVGSIRVDGVTYRPDRFGLKPDGPLRLDKPLTGEIEVRFVESAPGAKRAPRQPPQKSMPLAPVKASGSDKKFYSKSPASPNPSGKGAVVGALVGSERGEIKPQKQVEAAIATQMGVFDREFGGNPYYQILRPSVTSSVRKVIEANPFFTFQQWDALSRKNIADLKREWDWRVSQEYNLSANPNTSGTIEEVAKGAGKSIGWNDRADFNARDRGFNADQWTMMENVYKKAETRIGDALFRLSPAFQAGLEKASPVDQARIKEAAGSWIFELANIGQNPLESSLNLFTLGVGTKFERAFEGAGLLGKRALAALRGRDADGFLSAFAKLPFQKRTEISETVDEAYRSMKGRIASAKPGDGSDYIPKPGVGGVRSGDPFPPPDPVDYMEEPNRVIGKFYKGNDMTPDHYVLGLNRGLDESDRGASKVIKFLSTVDGLFHDERERQATMSYIRLVDWERLEKLQVHPSFKEGKIGIQLADEIRSGVAKIDGLFTRHDSMVSISRAVATKSDLLSAYKTIVHEVGHHLQKYVSPKQMTALSEQYEREMLANPDKRWTDFNEWWAVKIEDYEAGRLATRMMPKEAITALDRLAAVREVLVTAWIKLKHPDDFERVYKRMLKKG